MRSVGVKEFAEMMMNEEKEEMKRMLGFVPDQ